MTWLLKALIQKTISALPKSESLNYFLQKKITRKLPVNDEVFLKRFQRALKHYQNLVNFCSDRSRPVTTKINQVLLSQLKLFEFGAGQDLNIPLSFSALGVKNQTLIDISPLVKLELIQDTFKKLRTLRSIIEQKFKLQLDNEFYQRIQNFEQIKNIDELQALGISYLAPQDAKQTKFENNAFDLITSTNTLEHISKSDILKILKECYRVLKPQGILSCIIDMRDHYADADQNISVYNFLKYSDAVWNLLFNNNLHYQNRLRIDDYLRLIEETKLKILKIEKIEPDKSELDELEKLKLNKKFQNKNINNISVKKLFIVLQKQERKNYLI